MTRETAAFLLRILDTQQLNAGAVDFEEVALSMIAARRELIALVAESPYEEN